MKLELKHLAAYLPYGLNLIFEKSGRVINMQSCFNNGGLQIIDNNEGNTYDLSIWKFRPILTRLSELNFYSNGIKHLGYRTDENNFHNLISDIKNDKANYDLMNMCFKEHIDVFGLIDEGLAIDKNIIKN